MLEAKQPPVVNDTDTVFKVILRTDGSFRYFARLEGEDFNSMDSLPEFIQPLFTEWLKLADKKEGEEKP